MKPTYNFDNNDNNRYLVIGGAPKSGTTSLFRYISDHPEICPSNRKETYFFAREFDYNKVCTSGETLSDYEKYYEHCIAQTCIRVEGTPYTLYAKDAPQKIANLLKDVSLLFILREPTDRLLSDYRFHKQRNHPSTQGSLEEFFDWQNSMEDSGPNLIHLGCYEKYLRPFFDTFGSGRVFIMYFEELKSNPRDQMLLLSQFLGIDQSFYGTYNFNIHNPTVNYRYSWMNKFYMDLEPRIATLRTRIIRFPLLNRFFESIINNGKNIYRSINKGGKNEQESFSPEVLQNLRSFYQPYNVALSQLTGRSLPWKSFEA